jgi:hypothetical protein
VTFLLPTPTITPTITLTIVPTVALPQPTVPGAGPVVGTQPVPTPGEPAGGGGAGPACRWRLFILGVDRSHLAALPGLRKRPSPKYRNVDFAQPVHANREGHLDVHSA